MARGILLGAMVALACVPALHLEAQAVPQVNQPVLLAVPPANPADVASIDAIIHALYDVISGPAGQARDWNRFRSLFVPGGMLVPTGGQANGARSVRLMSPSDYVATSGSRLAEIGFREREIARREEQYGSIAHVFSTYESYRGAETEPFARGINSIQLLNDGSRWWILTVYWQGESQAVPLPAKYLPGGGG